MFLKHNIEYLKNERNTLCNGFIGTNSIGVHEPLCGYSRDLRHLWRPAEGDRGFDESTGFQLT